MNLSVIICTHNPRKDYLSRTLDALKAQTLPKEQWELLVVDNASKEPLASQWDLGWHPAARIIREDRVGLTHARLRGIQESTGKLLVFVDDDNVLDKGYLDGAMQIYFERPYIGAWGACSVVPEFEIPPPEWTKPYWNKICVYNFDEDRWSNGADNSNTIPCGAGMCIRKFIALKYAEAVRENPARIKLGRSGNNLFGGEDTDLALTACDMGYGVGFFKRLKMTHLIPQERLQQDYLLRLSEQMALSSVVLSSIRGKPPTVQRRSFLRIKMGQLRRLLTMRPRQRRFYEAHMRGYIKGAEAVAKWTA